VIVHVNNGKGQFLVIGADSTGEAIRRVNAEYPGFGGYYCDIVTPGGPGRWFNKVGGPYCYTPQAKGIRHDDRSN
jgi:hypothetical protein